jgi:hypothetical protein
MISLIGNSLRQYGFYLGFGSTVCRNLLRRPASLGRDRKAGRREEQGAGITLFAVHMTQTYVESRPFLTDFYK